MHQPLLCDLFQAANLGVVRFAVAAAAAACAAARADMRGRHSGQRKPISKCCAAPQLPAPTPHRAPDEGHSSHVHEQRSAASGAVQAGAGLPSSSGLITHVAVVWKRLLAHCALTCLFDLMS